MKNPKRITMLLALFLFLSACGGGGGSGSDPVPLADCRLGASEIGECKL